MQGLREREPRAHEKIQARQEVDRIRTAQGKEKGEEPGWETEWNKVTSKDMLSKAKPEWIAE